MIYENVHKWLIEKFGFDDSKQKITLLYNNSTLDKNLLLRDSPLEKKESKIIVIIDDVVPRLVQKPVAPQK